MTPTATVENPCFIGVSSVAKNCIPNPQLDLFASKPTTTEQLARIIDHLSDGQWRRSSQLLRQLGLPFTDNNRRKLREIAENSLGQIAGGQDGYKLIEMMTHEEYTHWRNWMRSQTRKMLRRTLQADKVFYRKHPKNI